MSRGQRSDKLMGRVREIMGLPEIATFLSHFVVEGKGAGSTQNQACNALSNYNFKDDA